MSLLVFGNGDGGGGPLAKMLENVRLRVFEPRGRCQLTCDDVAPSHPRHFESIAGHPPGQHGPFGRRVLRRSREGLKRWFEASQLVRVLAMTLRQVLTPTHRSGELYLEVSSALLQTP